MRDSEVEYKLCIKGSSESVVKDVADTLLDICLNDTEDKYLINDYIFGNKDFQITASCDKEFISFRV